MEMPEGFAKLVNEFSPERLVFAMRLMKEMAESLEDAAIAYNEDKYDFSINPSIALQKFKDWK